MKTSIRSRRLRNTHQHEEKQKDPFFSQTSERGRRQFFNAQQGSGQAVQEKLTVGKPGDRYEQEADRVASDVVARNNESPGGQRQGLDSIQRVTLMSPVEDEKLGTAEARMEKDKLIQEKIQRMGGQKEEEKKVQAKEEEEVVQAKEEEEEVQAKEEEEEVQAKEEEEEVQAKGEEEEVQAKEEEEEVQAKEEEEEMQAKEEGGRVASPNVSEKIKMSAGSGIPLSGEVRDEMERAFGADFSGVNIHTDADAVRMNRELRSQAFTRGQDIFFNEGKYRPETSAGKQLLAHELAHVVQQCGRKVAAKNKKSK